jgi:hypothetical protein
MPLQATSGAASYDAFGGGVPVAINYIEDVFQTWLYTGNGSTQTITNGIDLAGKGGLVWIKRRDGAGDHTLTDTVRGASNVLYSNATSAQSTDTQAGAYSYLSSGFDVYSASGLGTSNRTGATYASWTFRKQPKFFDIQTFTTTTEPSSPVTISHNLGSTPGFVFIKNMSLGNDWYVYHRSTGNDKYLTLNTTEAATTLVGSWAVTSTTVSIKDNFLAANSTFVVYLCAHDAGGFGLTCTDNVISCGAVTYDSTNGNTINLGYEAQFVILKSTTAVTQWYMQDIMRGMASGPDSGARLFPNLSNAEDAGFIVGPTATGFNIKPGFFSNGNNVIYIAIRRGPMKVPTSGTSVYNTATDILANAEANVGFPADMTIQNRLSGGTHLVNDRLRGNSVSLYTDTTAAEGPFGIWFDSSVGFWNGHGSGYHYYGTPNFTWAFKRAPSFFDEVCYTGTGANRTVTHNLGVAPELMIIKSRADAKNWGVYVSALGNGSFLNFNTTSASGSTTTLWNSTSPTSSVFTVGTAVTTNESAITYVAYLFATCAGVSKVGSYTGNGSTQTINCGFGAGGARFVLIKRTDSTGDWYVYDTARGMTTLTDPYLLLNTTAAESATLGSVTTVSTGFALDSTILAAINVSAATYIFLAIA